jgi:hypothetical protein
MPAETKSHRILRFILYLSNSNPKTREECCQFLDIKDSAFYNYCNVLRDTGFDLVQEEGKYRIEYPDEGHSVLRNIFHFSDEENYLLVKVIDALDTDTASSVRPRHKLVSFLNRSKTPRGVSLMQTLQVESIGKRIKNAKEWQLNSARRQRPGKTNYKPPRLERAG